MAARHGIGPAAMWGVLAAALLSAEPRPVDTGKSVMTVRVYKAGVLSALGHDHEISAPVAAGKADPEAKTVELHVKASALRVQDAKASEKDRGEIQKTMLGPEVLNVESHPEITFRSTSVESSGSGAWTVRGNLSLHGETKPVTVEVREKDGHYAGSAILKQTDFGIKPIRIAGGTVKVKDQIRIEFDIQLAH